MTTMSGLLGLVRGVRAFFTAQSVTANVVVGWTARSRIDNEGTGGANRVVFTPGELDPTSGAPKVLKAGQLDRDAGQTDYVGYEPRLRALAWWHAPVSVSVWAAGADPQDEEQQIEAVETLLEQTIQAIHNATDPTTGQAAGFANIEEWGPVVWTTPPGEASFGREVTFSFVLRVPLFDVPIGVAHPQGQVNRGGVT